MRRIMAYGLAVTAAAVTASGCAVQDITLPGGPDVGSHPYTVTAQFSDVVNLVPQSAVKVNDVAVGRVTKVSLAPDGWTANVTMVVNRSVRLPRNTTAQLEQSSLLGEKYVKLAATDNATTGQGSLGDHAVIPTSHTNRDPEVEEIFGALSMLLNGGGVAQLRTITTELNHMMSGNEPQIRSLVEQLKTLAGNLDSNKANITAALDGMNRLSATLSSHDQQIGTALDGLTPGLKVLDQQRGQLVQMLQSLNGLSDVAVSTVNRSKDDMVRDLTALEPTLRKLSDAGNNLPQSLQVLLTYPFTDAVLPAIKGDYLNVYLSVTAQPGSTQIVPSLPLPSTGGGH